MIAAIMLLFVALVILFACLITRGTCSNTANNGILPMDSTDIPIIDVITTDVPTDAPTEIPEITAQPTSVLTDAPTAVPTDAPTQPPAGGGPVIPQSPYPSIPYCLLEGSFQDVLARLELLEKLPQGETVILVDVGHGGFDGGTVGIDTGVTEASINLEVSKKVAQYLASKGYYVLMTRMGDYALARSKNEDMRVRKNLMKNSVFDVSVSIHMNALATDRSVRGARVYCYKNGTAGETLAKYVAEALSNASSYAKSKVYTGNLMVVREPICPSTLVECGFLSNSEEERLLRDQSYQWILAKAIAEGIESYLNGH